MTETIGVGARFCVIALLTMGLLSTTACSSDDGGGDSNGAKDTEAVDAGIDAGTACDPAKCPDPANPCLEPICKADGTCATALVDDDKACDDNDECTKSTLCKAGQCGGGTNVCACKTDADCQKGDSNKCDGTMYCDTTADGSSCKLNPATVVTCDPGKDTVCNKNTCAPATGECAMVPAGDTVKCDDGDKCTTGDVCDGKGACKSGPNTCDCKTDADCDALTGGDLCKGDAYCSKSTDVWTCKINPGTVTKCSDVGDTACMKNKCAPKTGKCAMTPQKDDTPCDDGDTSTKSDACLAGKCVGTSVACKSGTWARTSRATAMRATASCSATSSIRTRTARCCRRASSTPRRSSRARRWTTRIAAPTPAPPRPASAR